MFGRSWFDSVGDSDFFFVPRSCNVDQFTFQKKSTNTSHSTALTLKSQDRVSSASFLTRWVLPVPFRYQSHQHLYSVIDKKSRFVTIVIIVDVTFDAFVVWEGSGERERRGDKREGRAERVHMVGAGSLRKPVGVNLWQWNTTEWQYEDQ